jgi:hypothetical protein
LSTNQCGAMDNEVRIMVGYPNDFCYVLHDANSSTCSAASS